MYKLNRKSHLIIIVLVLSLVLSCSPLSQVKEAIQDEAQAVIGQIGEGSTESEAEVTQSASSGAVSQASGIRYEQPFAEYSQVDVQLPDAFQGGYTLPLNLNTVRGVDSFNFSTEQLDLLAKNGFVVAAPDAETSTPEFYQTYEYYRYDEQPVFITTDAVFHVYHLLFDKILRDLEREYFVPSLEELTLVMLNASQEQYLTLAGSPLEEPARRNLAFFSVAAQLLEIQDAPPTEVYDLVQAELALIDSHSIPAESPIWFREDLPADKRLIEDYSQYVPRGHYTRSESLERYFKAMMWYGRLTFRLRDDFETQRALLLTRALQDSYTANGPAATLWSNIFEPVTFLVGKIDDPSYFEYSDLSGAVFGADCALTDYADTALLEEFSRQANELPPPQVNSMWVWIWEDKEDATRGFRFMGQRFTLDEYLFDQLMWRNVGTMDNQRSLPKGLDIFAAMGSDEAYSLLDEMGETSYENYNTQMDKVKNEVSVLQSDSWTQNLYWSWLYAFQPIIEVKNERFPAFMQTQAWSHKDLQTALGSLTELKHDTILYAKQVMAEMGGGGMDEPNHGYIEPNPLAFARLNALSKMTYDGLESRNLLDANTAGSLQNLMDLLNFLTSSAEKELRGEPLSDDDYWRIQYFGGELEALTIAAADAPDEEGRLFLQDQRAALIADVATGSGAALEEAVGNPTPIYVVLPDQPWRVAIGVVYTYYEFSVASDQRMTDEAWQGMLDNGNNPDQPAWTDSFIAP